MTETAIIIVLAFLGITFIQSGYDKVVDWKGNVEWLKGHFAATPLKNVVPQSLIVVVFLEILAGAFSVIGIIKILMGEGNDFAYWAAVLSAVTLLVLLLGQRIAKDYDGARTIVIYFIPVLILLHWLAA